MAIDKSKADRLAGLNKPKAKSPSKEAPEDAPERRETAAEAEEQKVTGYAGKDKSSYRDFIRNLVLSPETIDSLDDIAYELKKTLGKRVSYSEIARSAITHFAALDKKERNSYFVD